MSRNGFRDGFFFVLKPFRFSYHSVLCSIYISSNRRSNRWEEIELKTRTFHTLSIPLYDCVVFYYYYGHCKIWIQNVKNKNKECDRIHWFYIHECEKCIIWTSRIQSLVCLVIQWDVKIPVEGINLNISKLYIPPTVCLTHFYSIFQTNIPISMKILQSSTVFLPKHLCDCEWWAIQYRFISFISSQMWFIIFIVVTEHVTLKWVTM